MNLQESIRRILREETEDGIKDILFDIFDENTKGAEIYEYDNSLWMILPEQKEWVFEIDIDLTLWYNYKVFRKFFKYTSLDVFDNQQYITEWVEDTIKTEIKSITNDFKHADIVDEIIETGVRNTIVFPLYFNINVQDIIKTGKKG